MNRPESDATNEKGVEAAVLDRFRHYLGIGVTEDLSPSSRLIEDLAVDSVVLAAILVEMENRLGLDITAIGAALKDLHTVGDVIALAESRQQASSRAASLNRQLGP